MKKILFTLLFGISMSISTAQEIGLQLYSLRNQFKDDVEGTLKLIRSWGITSIEGGQSYGMERNEFSKLLNKYGLKMVSIQGTFEDLSQNPQKVIEDAKAWDVEYVMCAWVPHEKNQWALEETKHATNIFNSAGKLLKENGITLAYHAHGYEFKPYEEGTFFDYMAKNAEHFTFELDVYWVQYGGEDPLKLIEKHSDKISLLHLKDMKKGIIGDYSGHSNVETNVPLGAGQIDIRGIVLEAKKLGIEYMFIEDESSKVVQQIPKSLKYLNLILE